MSQMTPYQNVNLGNCTYHANLDTLNTPRGVQCYQPSSTKGGKGVQSKKGGGTESIEQVSNSQKVKPMANTRFAA